MRTFIIYSSQMISTFSRRSKENMPNCGVLRREKEEGGSETYEDNEGTKQCIDYMYCRNLELYIVKKISDSPAGCS